MKPWIVALLLPACVPTTSKCADGPDEIADAAESDTGTLPIDAMTDASQSDTMYTPPPPGISVPYWPGSFGPCVPPRDGIYGEGIHGLGGFTEGDAYATVFGAFQIDRTFPNPALGVNCDARTFIDPHTCLGWCCPSQTPPDHEKPPIIHYTVDGWESITGGYCGNVWIDSIVGSMRH